MRTNNRETSEDFLQKLYRQMEDTESINQDGGYFWGMFGNRSDDMEQKRRKVIKLLLDPNVPATYIVNEDEKMNLVHKFIKYYINIMTQHKNENGDTTKLFNSVFAKKQIKEALNTKDANGNYPIFYVLDDKISSSDRRMIFDKILDRNYNVCNQDNDNETIAHKLLKSSLPERQNLVDILVKKDNCITNISSKISVQKNGNSNFSQILGEIPDTPQGLKSETYNSDGLESILNKVPQTPDAFDTEKSPLPSNNQMGGAEETTIGPDADLWAETVDYVDKGIETTEDSVKEFMSNLFGKSQKGGNTITGTRSLGRYVDTKQSGGAEELSEEQKMECKKHSNETIDKIIKLLKLEPEIKKSRNTAYLYKKAIRARLIADGKIKDDTSPCESEKMIKSYVTAKNIKDISEEEVKKFIRKRKYGKGSKNNMKGGDDSEDNEFDSDSESESEDSDDFKELFDDSDKDHEEKKKEDSEKDDDVEIHAEMNSETSPLNTEQKNFNITDEDTSDDGVDIKDYEPYESDDE